MYYPDLLPRSTTQIYYPDYVFVMLALPLVVIKAKAPSKSVEEGYRQARLYSHELNALFATGLNPAKFNLCYSVAYSKKA